MTMRSTVSRRGFLKMGSAASLGAACLPGMTAAGESRRFAAAGGLATAALLNGNEYPYGPTPAAVAKMQIAAVEGNRYHNEATAEFSLEMAAYHGLKPEYLTLYTGSSDPLRFTTIAFTSATRSLVTADPVYELAWGTALANGVKLHRVPLKPDFTYDMKAMLAADPQAGLFYLCNPNNPTGGTLARAEIEWLLANKPAGSIVLVDEAYIHFSNADSVIDLVAADGDLVVIRSFSKIYSMAGLRFGYAMARPDLMRRIRAFGINHVPTTSVQCAKAQLNDPLLVPQRKQANAETRDAAVAWLAKAGYRCTPSQANSFLLDMQRPAAGVAAALAQKNVMIGRSWAIMPNWARITIGSPAEMAAFRTAFAQVMEVPEAKTTAMLHPYPHVLRATVC
jgi:histidinol-phosphate aminotransferase